MWGKDEENIATWEEMLKELDDAVKAGYVEEIVIDEGFSSENLEGPELDTVRWNQRAKARAAEHELFKGFD